MLVDLINSATTTLDILTPGFSSWSHCTSVRSVMLDQPSWAHNLPNLRVATVLGLWRLHH